MATQFQVEQLNMFQTVENQVDTNSVILFAIPGFKAKYTEFKVYLIQLFQLNEEHTTDGSGASSALKQLRLKLINTSFSIGSKVAAYARFIGDQLLLSEVNFTKTDLRARNYQNLVSAGEIIYDRANALISSLTDHKITAVMLTDYKALLDECRKAIPSPRISINKKASTGKSMSQLIRASVLLLEDMDAYIEVIHESNTVIFEAYKRARKINKLPSKRQAVVGKITEASSNSPIKGATISFYSYSDDQTLKAAANGNVNPRPMLVKRSAARGGFKVNSLPDGMYRVEIKRTGFKTVTSIVAVSLAETTKMAAGMEKV